MIPQIRLIATALAWLTSFGIAERAYWLTDLDPLAVLFGSALLLSISIWHRPLRRGLGQLTERGGASA